MHRFLAACSMLFLLPFSVRASGPTFISEIAWAGSSASLADEWVELCGTPGTDLSGWSIEGAAANPIALPGGSVIPASGAYVIANYAADDARSVLAIAPDVATTAISLSNANLFIALRDASGAIVDAAGAPETAPFAGTSGEAKASMERSDPSLDGSGAEAWVSASASSGFDPGAVELGTPGACQAPARETPTTSTTSSEEMQEASDAPEPMPTRAEPPSALRISEIYPSPNSGEYEWVELVMPSSVGEIIDGWTIEDAKGTKTALGGVILPWGRVVVASPKGSLNNDGDAVIVRDARGRAVDRVEYPKTRKGEAFMRVELQDAFVMTRTPTPGAVNVFMSTEEAVASEEPVSMETSPPPIANAPKPAPQHVILSEAKDPSPIPERDPSTSLRSAQDDRRSEKPVAKPKATPVSRYKGEAYAATVVVPPGVYSKTRAYVQREGGIEELRLSKSPAVAWSVGERISFVAQTKTEGAVSFLLANPNSVRATGSASATFTTADAWPKEAGGYSFTAEVASIRGDALEVTLGGVEGDVLVPSGTASALKPGDTVRVEGFIAPGARPRVVLPYAHALRLFEPRLPDDAAPTRAAKLPASLAVGLTFAAAAVGFLAYLRMQRLKRLALLQAPIEEGAWGMARHVNTGDHR